MISVNSVTLQFGKEPLFKDVNISFTDGNCYGLIGANGSGKSTFLKVLSGELEPNAGSVAVPRGQRISMLKQDHFAFNEETALSTVIIGHKNLHDIILERDKLYSKSDFNDADGHRLAELDDEFNKLGGWSLEAEAGKLLSSLGVKDELHTQEMKQLDANIKVRVLLAQALIGNPDVLLLDEPTNHLDMETCMWLEEFLIEFNNTAIIVSHDRHFLDKVCTHIADIDFNKIELYTGNYSFWSESRELALRQRQDRNRKLEEKRKELLDFIARFSANASKSRQATSRKKTLQKLNLEEIKPSSRKYPYIELLFDKDAGNDLLSVKGLSKAISGESVFKDFSLNINKGEKVAFLGPNDAAKTALFEVLTGQSKADAGEYQWGAAVKYSYFPKDFGPYFQRDLPLIDWLRQYSDNTDESFIRSFLGKMLFRGEDAFKSVLVLSGGEKVRCMLAKLMLSKANTLIMDEPTNHLDLESITALNNGLIQFKGTLLLASQDHAIVQSVADHIVEITPNGYIDRPRYSLDEYLEAEAIKNQRAKLYSVEK
ncbi:MAG: ATP-binding cassette domain-containing protein [Candidatus Omnitrophica bacterium]|nr:ATP-binding cassette domain-containing protein [Candidatus Omnitrophota bacterium]